MPVRLTDDLIRDTKPPARDRLTLYDDLVSGLSIRITSKGVRTWSIHYRIGGGKTRRFTIGPWKHVDRRGKGLSVSEARKRAEKELAKIQLGEDPQGTKAVRARPGEYAVVDMVADMIESLPLSPKTVVEWTRLQRVEIAKLGDASAAGLTRSQVRDWLKRIKSPWTANRSFEVLRRAYTWGLSQGEVEHSPCVGLSLPHIETENDRVLSTEEVRAVLQALDKLGVNKNAKKTNRPRLYADAVRLLFLTGARRDMVQGARVEEFEALGTPEARWIVPADRAKRKRRAKKRLPHVIPLSQAAEEIATRRIAKAQGGYLFPRQRRSRLHPKPPSPMVWSSRFAKELRDKAEEILKRKMERWTVHGIRHTVATHLREDLKVSRDVVSLILGHAPGGPASTRVYDRAEMLEERREALQKWAAWLGL